MTGQPDYSGSAMLALYPDAAAVAALVQPGALDPAQLHVTLVYTGDAADTDPEALNLAAKTLAGRPPLTAQISGLARFAGGESDVLVALVDSPDLEDLRRAATDHCARTGIAAPREHGYTAHCTLMYLAPGDPAPLHRLPPLPVTFAAVSAVHGDTRTDYPFTAPAETQASLARAAYATGWARSGGPMTDRVKAGCTAAMHLAQQCGHAPGVLEVALKLGALEGAWALVYQRREQQIRDHAAAANAAWRSALTRGRLADAVADLRRRLGLAEDRQSDADRDRRIRDAAAAAAAAMLQLLPGRPAWQQLRRALRDALAAGQAEGIVGAVAIAAEQTDRVGLDWDLAFEHAYAALDNLELLWGQADGWLGRMLERATTDLGRALADAARSDTGYEQMLADAMDALGSDDVDAVSFIVDWAMTEAQRRGALDLYASEGVARVDWLTAGDARVCAACEDNEANGPYAPSDYPALPHPRCVIGSTRVAVPASVVTGDEAHGLALHPSKPEVGLTGERGATAASTMTEPFASHGFGAVRAVSDREYVGDVVTIRTALGYELTATPNHPIATRCGWVPLAELAVGDDVISCAGTEWLPFAGMDPDVDHIPPRIEDVAQAFPVVLGPVPTAAEDFHGDGAGSEVHVVRTNGFLMDYEASTLSKRVGQCEFGWRDVTRDTTLHRGSPRDQFLSGDGPSSGGIVGCACKPASFGGTCSRHTLVHGRTASTDLHPGPLQAQPNCSPADADSRRHCLRAHASRVEADDLGAVHLDLILAHMGFPRNADALTALAQPIGDDAPARSDTLPDFVKRLATAVAVDEIVHVERKAWHGHVYNLDTESGFYISNGILTHNCRCSPSVGFDVSNFDAWFTAD